MTRKKMDNKIPRLEPQFHDVLICKKNDCRPFLEVLIEEPENITHQNLGILVGIFQIDDRSEDSSYVVNYLISIIKKEYFSRANRGPVENFEAALHKANLALAKLATHENIGWIGSINAICAVIEKNNLLLSQTGNASAFLLRATTLAEITEAPLEETDSNPLKTFQDVISGKIEKNDKLIFTTKELFDIFSLEEIKKSALKFSRENFIQFLNTALVNELDQVATLVIDISEKIPEPVELPSAKKIDQTNVFSQTAFQKELSPRMLEKARIKEENITKERQAMILELKEDAKDFVDKKTGHIYIKEPRNFSSEDSEGKTGIDFAPIKEKLSDLTTLVLLGLKQVKNKTTNIALPIWQKGTSKISQIRLREKNILVKNAPIKIAQQVKSEKSESKVKLSTVTIAKAGASIGVKAKTAYSKLEIKSKTLIFLEIVKKSADFLSAKTTDGLILLLQRPTRLTIEAIDFFKNKWQTYRAKKIAPKYPTKKTTRYPWENISTNPAAPSETNSPKPIATFLEKATSLGKIIETKKILPNFSRLKQILTSFDRKQKISALAVLILLLVVPYWIVKWENKPEEKPVAIEEAPPIFLPLEKDLRVSRIEKLSGVYIGNILKIINLNNKFFALKEREIIDLENKKSLPLPAEFQNPELFFGMDDLNLIFLIKDNKITSLSPTTGKLQNNTLNFSPDGKIIDAKTYLTYIYLLDASNNQIYRAPRAEGGFGEKTTWTKEALNLASAKSLAINENIFVLNGQTILKLFRGKKLDFSIETTATPLVPDKLYAQNTGTNLYVLDKTNARIIKLNNDGKILAQYYNTEIATASDFSASEENNLIYISGKDGVKSFEMN
jgi:hypothetical protein